MAPKKGDAKAKVKGKAKAKAVAAGAPVVGLPDSTESVNSAHLKKVVEAMAALQDNSVLADLHLRKPLDLSEGGSIVPGIKIYICFVTFS